MTNAQMLAELTRMKVLFQARALAAAMGVPQPNKLPTTPRPTWERADG